MKQIKYHKRNGYEFHVVDRIGNVARAIGSNGKAITHEVFIVQSHEGREINGKSFPPAEFPPSNEQWGSKGWTFVTEEAAKERFLNMTGNLTSAPKSIS